MDFTQVIQINKNHASAYYERGLSQSKLGNRQAALADLKQAAALYQQRGYSDFYQETLNRIKQLLRNKSRIALYEGDALNTTANQPGKVSIEIIDINKTSGKMIFQVSFSRGLNGEGEFVGTIDQNNLVETSGQLATSEAGGIFDTYLRLEISNNHTIKGIYKIYPRVGSLNNAQEGEFTATKVNSNSNSNYDR